MNIIASLIVFLPLLAAIIVGLNTRIMPVKAAQFITASFCVVSAICSAIMFKYIILEQNILLVEILPWITSGALKFSWNIWIDPLTAVMLVVVTFVSSLVHIYSVGYMGHDPHPQRFMSYLSLFTFFMLVLVTSNNLVQVFVGWEGVGLCSYLLIGFWYKKPSANAAAMKAFIVNRVGDFGFALGLFALYLLYGSLDFGQIFIAATVDSARTIEFWGYEFHAITLVCILLFIGAMGKSAQLGLHTWLPDAMEGPTPVSALIHAATMVTAGVFLVARCSPLFELSEVARDVVTVVGAITCLFAATIAITQNDIKRVIAYSTCSQLGYMFFACGVSAYSAGIFHLMTHGFFKALLFLGAGSVIHAMSNEQDMRNMGGIHKKIPFTFAMMIIGTLAITGVPPLSGYFSKDMIIESAYAAGHAGNQFGNFAFWVGVSAALLTAFYSWRLIFMTFFGEFRSSPKTYDHVHESPKIMTIPLLILAIGAIFAGYGAVQMGIVEADLQKFWGYSIVMFGENNVLEDAHHVPSWVKLSPMIVGTLGLFAAILCYIIKPSLSTKISQIFAPIYKLFYNKWYFDELYDFIFVRPIKKLGLILWKCFDAGLIDRFGPNGFAAMTLRVAGRISKIQTGFVYHYAFVMLLGILGMLSYYSYKAFW